MPAAEATLIIAASEADANLYYAARFLAPDPFIFLEVAGEKVLLLSDLEIDRGRQQAAVQTVLPFSRYEEEARRAGEATGLAAVAVRLLRERGVSAVQVPANFPLGVADDLRARGVTVRAKPDPFYDARTVKTAEEVAAISHALAATEGAMDVAIGALRAAEMHGGVLTLEGEVLTSERVKRMIAAHLLERDYLAQHTIVAGGDQGCDPHEDGHGPLRADTAIIIDIFPRSIATRYHGDLTRTVVKGEASAALRNQYAAVRAAQEEALVTIRAGVEGPAVHARVCSLFEARGYRTGEVGGRMQGFFHGTGHGLGLEIHEPPRVSKIPATLQAGNVVTVEPGLYYPGVGGVRLEDVVVVTETSCTNLVKYPKLLEI
ncbi:MAG: Xaa-Pro peptidase family protein [candidate division NC10 bacterium]|nr:Xaa-Pro peptidase family protein [candidate division NC10 bacterium]